MVESKDRRVSKRTFTRLLPETDAWFEREAARLRVKKAHLIREALVAYKRGAKGMVLSQPEQDWLEIYRMFAGLAGDVETLRSITIVATRSFVDAATARTVRELAAKLSLAAPPPVDRDGE